MSPSASWAYSVMPIRTEPSCSPGWRTHSCSTVYLRSSGYMQQTLLRRVGVLGLGQLHGALDVERRQLLDLDGGAVLLEQVARAEGELDSGGQGVRVADHVDDVRRGDQLPADQQTAGPVRD